jgi:hypothetical protein
MKGRIALIIDPKVSGPLSLVVEFSTLQTYGVEKIFLLQQSVSSLQTDCDHIVYLTKYERSIYSFIYYFFIISFSTFPFSCLLKNKQE